MNVPNLVSIIIPLYNTEKYLRACLESVLAQTYSSIECIIVDDCSTDCSSQIATDVIANNQSPICFKFITHHQNKGLSATRNTGCSVATGEYIYFLDSDDIIDSDTILLMVREIQNRGVDFVAATHDSLYPNPSAVTERCTIEDEVFIYDNTRKIIKAFSSGLISSSPWNKLIRKKIIDDYHLRFPIGRVHEDCQWNLDLMLVAHRCSVLPFVTYHWLRHEGSITSRTNNKLREDLVCIADYHNQKQIEFQNAEFYPELKVYTDMFVLKSMINVLTLRNGVRYNHKLFNKINYKRNYSVIPSNIASMFFLYAVKCGDYFSFLYLLIVSSLHKKGIVRIKFLGKLCGNESAL